MPEKFSAFSLLSGNVKITNSMNLELRYLYSHLLSPVAARRLSFVSFLSSLENTFINAFDTPQLLFSSCITTWVEWRHTLGCPFSRFPSFPFFLWTLLARSNSDFFSHPPIVLCTGLTFTEGPSYLPHESVYFTFVVVKPFFCKVRCEFFVLILILIDQSTMHIAQWWVGKQKLSTKYLQIHYKENRVLSTTAMFQKYTNLVS